MSFAHPWLLLLLPLPALLLLVRRRWHRKLSPAAGYSSLTLIGRTVGRRAFWRGALPLSRAVVLALLVVALARPRFGRREVEVTSEGIDIVLAVDISGSMKAEDMRPNRLGAAKAEAESFIDGRTSDRIGLVVFASNSYTQCPLTTDYEVLKRLLRQVDYGEIKDGTAIGMAIANGTNRLKDVPGKSKVMVLLTDGRNNAGAVDPITAAELAHSLRVRIYTVGVGTTGQAPYPVDDPVFGKRYVQLPADVDEVTLTRIAEITGGQFFRATDNDALDRIFRQIDQMEKTKVETRQWVNYSEIGSYLAIPALILLLLEVVLGATALRRLP